MVTNYDTYEIYAGNKNERKSDYSFFGIRVTIF